MISTFQGDAPYNIGMNRVFLTGDTHGELELKKLSAKNFPLGKTLTKDDFMVVLGDFGLVWDSVRYTVKQHRVRGGLWEQTPRTEYEVVKKENCGPDKPSEVEEYWLDWLKKKPWTTLFCCGNHENFDRLLAYPTESFHGGQASKVWDSVWYLRRGEVYDLGGRSFFTFGGAVSTDKEHRVEKVSWWPEEVPSEDDVRNGLENLRAHGNRVDYVLTHTCPNAVRYLLPSVAGTAHGYCLGDKVGEILDGFYDSVDFGHWFFGHYHMNYDLDKRFTTLHSEVREV